MRLLRSVSVVGAQVEKVQIVEEGGGRRVRARQHIARD